LDSILIFKQLPPTHPSLLELNDYIDYPELSLSQNLVKRIQQQPFNQISFLIFCLAIGHTFFTHKFSKLSKKIAGNDPQKLTPKKVFYSEILCFLGEVEVVFGLWIIPLMLSYSYFYGWQGAVEYLNSRNYTEPIFVVVIMALASTRPIIDFAKNCMHKIAVLGGDTPTSWWWSILTIGPLLGSLITEPGAMTILAVLLGGSILSVWP